MNNHHPVTSLLPAHLCDVVVGDTTGPTDENSYRQQLGQRWRNASWPPLLLSGLLICGSSCSSTSQYVQKTFQRSNPEQVAQAEAKPKDGARTDKSPEQAARTVAKSGAGTEKQTASAPQPDIRELIAKGKDPFGDSSIQQASNEQPAVPERPMSGEAISHAAPPRTPLNAQLASATASIPASACPPALPCPPAAPCAARPFPGSELTGDEYVCDGGDKGKPVHYEGLNRAGLEVEDTIAEYKDDTGKFHMKPSTEACIYAPRFGSVSSATLPEEGMQIARAAGHQDQNAVEGLASKTVIDQKTQSDEPQGMLMRSRASGLNNRQADDHLQQTQMAGQQSKVLNPFEDFRFLREGQFDVASNAVISLGVNAAQEWADGRRPIIVAKAEGGQIVQGRFTAQDYTGVEDKRSPGELKLVKVADRASAHPGDIVTFTIRFDNIGGRDLSSVRIVDNLSPRLEYIANSVSSSMEGNIDVSDNGAGGKLLTFEFDQPLKGKTGGFVSFQCRVR